MEIRIQIQMEIRVQIQMEIRVQIQMQLRFLFFTLPQLFPFNTHFSLLLIQGGLVQINTFPGFPEFGVIPSVLIREVLQLSREVLLPVALSWQL